MKVLTMYRKLADYIGEAALLEQMAEEASELSFAALKLARYIRGENKVHGKTEEEMRGALLEEAADVCIILNELREGGLIDLDALDDMIEAKCDRMNKRLEEEDLRDTCELSGHPGYIIKGGSGDKNVGVIFDEANAKAFADAGYIVTNTETDETLAKEAPKEEKKEQPKPSPYADAAKKRVGDFITDCMQILLSAEDGKTGGDEVTK